MINYFKPGRRLRLPTALVAAGLAGAACDVTNPGRILDADLNSESAMRVLVNGIGGDMTLAYREAGWNIEVLTGGLTGTSAYDSRIRHWQGRPQPEDADDYNSAWAAGWVADQGIERLQSVLGDKYSSSALAAEANVYGGIVYRLLGENMCQAVFDGGAPVDRVEYLKRSEKYFDEAVRIATAANNTRFLNAALGGRASVRMYLDKWPEAVADAKQVPTDFVFSVPMGAGSTRERNEIFYENQRRSNINVRFTYFQTYSNEFDDPRVVTVIDPAVGAADGSQPQVQHRRYTSPSDDVPAVKGTEARLIEAEYLITQTGEWQKGLEIINDLRTANGVPPRTASNQAEAFTALKLERGVELWLEHRRGGDLFRWGNTAAGDPILAKMYENVAAADQTARLPVPQAQRDICLPFSQRLAGTNPNIGG